MGTQIELQTLLKDILESDSVYFSPPPSIQMSYPCIVYKRDRIVTRFSNNKPYKNRKRYQLTVISRTPNSELVDKIAALPMCVHDRFFTADNLNHDVFNIYF